MILKKDEISDYFEYLQENKPLAKLFRTDNLGYLYDTGTGKVVQCSDIQFKILEKILSRDNIKESVKDLECNIDENTLYNEIQDIYNCIKEEDLLNVKLERKFKAPEHFNCLKKEINSGLEQLILEVTERCNLRCRYCTFGDEYLFTRNHGTEDMSQEVAYTSIDYLVAHSNANEVVISFYGGEPLLMYDLIKKCVEYSKKVIKSKKIKFTMTTNLTLITPEIAEYLCSVDNFFIVGSLDGPKQINDAFRKDIKGNGSFDRALEGLKNLVNAFGDLHKNRILLSMVYTPPYSENKLNEIKKFFDNLEWLPESVEKLITYPANGSLPKEYYTNYQLENYNDSSLLDWSQDMFFDSIKNNQNTKSFASEILNSGLLKVHKRRITDKADFSFPLNGCCIPGKHRLYISPKGEIRICERILGEHPSGNILDEINIDKIKKVYVDEYSELSINECSKCWIAKVCDECYASSFKQGVFDLKEKNLYCEIGREAFLSALKLYYKCYECNPDSLLYLNDEKIVT